MMQTQSLDDIVHVIQVALTPVFLLSGIASLLAVFATRLGRVADKVDALSEALDSASQAESVQILARLGYLRRRSHALDAAVVLGALAGVSTSAAALMLFVGTLRNGEGSTLMFLAFGAALVLTIGALTAFLTEMLMASRGIRAIVAAEKAQQDECGVEAEPEGVSHGANVTTAVPETEIPDVPTD
jgi:energy-converting hydrogenase Eha subunit E